MLLWEQNLDLEKNISNSFTPSEMAKRSFHYIQLVGHYVCRKNYSTRRENYDSFLILCTIKGKGCLKYRNTTYEITPDKVWFIDCKEYQEYHTVGEDFWETIWIHVNGANTKQYFENIMQNCGPVITVGDDRLIAVLIGSVFELIRNDDMQIELIAPQIIVSILTTLSTYAQIKQRNSANLKSYQAVKAAVEYIKTNYKESINVPELAELCNYTQHHFIRLFKSVTGYSPYEYLTKHRISVAKELLVTTNFSISEIAEAVGFKNQALFFSTFRKNEFLTPAKYRQSQPGTASMNMTSNTTSHEEHNLRKLGFFPYDKK